MFNYRCIVPSIVLLITAILGHVQDTHGQELLVNGSFEDHSKCPRSVAPHKLKGISNVRSVASSPTYFNSCSQVVGVPQNWAGHQAAKDGEGYMGMVLTSQNGDRTDRQYVQLELKEPLQNGHRYAVSFWVNAADGSGYITDRIGACFTETDRSRKGVLHDLIGKPDLENPLDRFLSDTTAWMKVEGTYNAKGGERFLIVGNFQRYGYSSRKAMVPNSGNSVLANVESNYLEMNDPDPDRGRFLRVLAKQAYCLLDEVSVVPLGSNASVDILTQERACAIERMNERGMELIPDPSFDHNTDGSRSFWQNASGGTPDLMDGVAGIYLFSGADKDHREFIQTPLKATIDPCGIYHYSMRVLRNSTYGFAVDKIGIALVENFKRTMRREPLEYLAQWSSPSVLVMDNPSQWITLCGEVRPSNCATDLVVGNFSVDSATTIFTTDPNGGPFAYYFVDDISLVRIGTDSSCKLVCGSSSEDHDRVENTLLVEGHEMVPIHFATSSHLPDTLDPQILVDLRLALEAEPTMAIIVEGHTDDTGTEAENKGLGLRRANAIRDLLVLAGIPFKNIRVDPVGSERPIGENATEIGRAMNRRVEIRWTKPDQ